MQLLTATVPRVSGANAGGENVARLRSAVVTWNGHLYPDAACLENAAAGLQSRHHQQQVVLAQVVTQMQLLCLAERMPACGKVSDQGQLLHHPGSSVEWTPPPFLRPPTFLLIYMYDAFSLSPRLRAHDMGEHVTRTGMCV